MKSVPPILLAMMCAATPGSVLGQEFETSAWQVEKCRIYEQSWAQALEFFGSDNINYNFSAGNENFIAAGCTEVAGACPRSSQELEIANALTLAMMNAGAASTFLPFKCSRDQGTRTN